MEASHELENRLEEGQVGVEVRGTQVTLHAEKIFTAEATGARADYGGWIAVHFKEDGQKRQEDGV